MGRVIALGRIVLRRLTFLISIDMGASVSYLVMILTHWHGVRLTCCVYIFWVTFQFLEPYLLVERFHVYIFGF
jgi:hypothetical protein